ncbi:MAG: efflux RND transporter permease subunit, partial [Pseudomonadota bacterium]
VIVVIVFLQTWRASIIPLLAVPVSIVGTFAVLWMLGFTINVLTLFGLVLAIGIVVDDAIVVVENVERHIEDGDAPLAAAHKAMAEVSGPIVAISLVLAAVFVPLSFIAGVTGQFYQQFAVTITVSVLISAVNSLTLSPALSAILLKPHGAEKDRLGRIMDRLFGWFFERFNRVFSRGSERYAGGIGGIIRRSKRLMVIYVLLLGVAFIGFRSVPGGFIPTQDKQYLFGVLTLPQGASIERTEAATRKMSEIGLSVDGVSSAVAFPGLNGAHFVNTPNLAVIFFGLAPAQERAASAVAISNELTGRFAEIKEGLAFAAMPPPLLGLGNSSGVEMFIQDRSGIGFGGLNNAVNALAGEVGQTPGFDPYQTYTLFQSNVPQLNAEVDRIKAKEQGIVLTDLYSTMQVYLGSAYVNDFNLFGRVYGVYAQADAEFRDNIADIGRLRTRNAQGQMVPVGSVVNIEEGFGPDPVIRYNGYPAADLTAAFAPADLTSIEAVSLTEGIAERILPRGVVLEWTNLTYQQVNQGNASLLVFPLAVLLVYLVLAALYESWSLPFAVILIVPMCLLSAIGGIWALNTIRGSLFGLQIASGAIPPPPLSVPPTFIDNNIFTQIGLVVLMGLACKNAILIVEFARDLERAGRGIVEAAVESCRLRLRPILMTSFAFIAGVLPLVFASGAGSEVRHVMGVTVFFGMLGVTFFGLFFTPIFYVLIRKISTRREPPEQESLRAAS